MPRRTPVGFMLGTSLALIAVGLALEALMNGWQASIAPPGIPPFPPVVSSPCCAPGMCGPGSICMGCACVPMPLFLSSSSSSAYTYGACCKAGSCVQVNTVADRADCTAGSFVLGAICGEIYCTPVSSSASSSSSSSEPKGACCNKSCIKENASRDQCGFFANFYPGQSCAQVSDCRDSSSSSSNPKGACCDNACIAENVTRDQCFFANFYPLQSCAEVTDCYHFSSSSSSSSASRSSRGACCTCVYMDAPFCWDINRLFAGEQDETVRTEKQMKACREALSPQNHKDCVWDNGLHCMPRYLKACMDWMNTPEQSICSAENRFIQDENSPLPDLRGCDPSHMIRMGHGRGCDHTFDLFTTCTRQCRDALCVTFDDIGCSPFANRDLAYARALAIQQDYLRKGQTATISANQTIAGWPTCQNRLTFTITADWIVEHYDPCKPGTYCYKGSEPITCFDTTTNTNVKLYCCKCYKGNNVWSDTKGNCPAPKERYSGVCSTTVLSLVSCMSAAAATVAPQKMCLEGKKILCLWDDYSDFQTTPLPGAVLPSNIHDYNSACFVRADTKYRCMSICKKS